MDHLVKEAIEIRLHPDNFNRDDGFNLSHTWRPVIKMLQRPRNAPMAKQGQAQVENKILPPAHRQGIYTFDTSDHDDDGRDGLPNVGSIRTHDADDGPR
jgi:hypothetical protein